MIGVLAFIFICCIVFILIRRKQAALGGNYNHHVEMQIHQLNDQWDVMSKKTYAADTSDGTTKEKTFNFTNVSGQAHTKSGYEY